MKEVGERKMIDVIIQLITAFLGALGFAILFQVEKKKLFAASFGGFLTWGCYIICSLFLQENIIRIYISSAMITIYAGYMAKKHKTPATVFLVPGSIPLIPGGSLYHTMSYALQENWQLFFMQGLNTILLAVAISCGILTTMTIMKIYYKIKIKTVSGAQV